MTQVRTVGIVYLLPVSWQGENRSSGGCSAPFELDSEHRVARLTACTVLLFSDFKPERSLTPC